MYKLQDSKLYLGSFSNTVSYRQIARLFTVQIGLRVNIGNLENLGADKPDEATFLIT